MVFQGRLIINYKVNDTSFDQKNLKQKLYIKPDLNIKNSKIIIIGEPGAGKTLYLRSLIEDYRRRKTKVQRVFKPLTIYLNASLISSSIEDAILTEISTICIDKEYSSRILRMIRRNILKGKIKLLIDGLDNLSGNNAKEKDIWNQLNQLLLSNKSFIYLTSRSEYYNNRYKEFIENSGKFGMLTEYSIPHFTLDEINEFIDRNDLKHLNKCDFKKSVNEGWEIKELVKKPMLLSILIFINTDRINNNLKCKVISSRYELYSDYYKILIKKEIDNINKYSLLRQYKFLLEDEQFDHMVSHISYVMLERNLYYVDILEFKKIIKEYFLSLDFYDIARKLSNY